jgi:DNA-binding transcriptional ArsR family regulator
MAMQEAQIYKALGDPVRLEMVQRLVEQSPLTLGEISRDLGVSRQGARKQIQVLVSANVVHLQPKGRQTQVTLDSASLRRAREFISRLEQQWDQRLQALKALVED